MAKLFAAIIEKDGVRRTFIEADTIRLRATDEGEPGFSVITVGLGSEATDFFAFDGQESLLERMTMSSSEYFEEGRKYIGNDFMYIDDDDSLGEYLFAYERWPEGEVRDIAIKTLQETHSNFFAMSNTGDISPG